MALTDLQVYTACAQRIEGADVSGTILADGWPIQRVIWPNTGDQDMMGRTIDRPRVEVSFFTVEPQQLGLGVGSRSRRRFLLEIDVQVEPRTGIFKARQAAEAFVAEFEVGTFIADGLYVRSRPQAAQDFLRSAGAIALEENLPVLIRLESFAK